LLTFCKPYIKYGIKVDADQSWPAKPLLPADGARLQDTKGLL
jgi:hypothetical protein